ncbi:MAG: hypothetical protein OJF50_001429 [Nitrospira sp.]|nr:hypothetical protein [Nitrospira sp.]
MKRELKGRQMTLADRINEVETSFPMKRELKVWKDATLHHLHPG